MTGPKAPLLGAGSRSPAVAVAVALGATLALLVIEACLFEPGVFPNGWRLYFGYVLQPGHNWRFRVGAIAFVLLSIAQLATGLLLLQRVRRSVRVLVLAASWMALALEYGYLGAYGRFSSDEDLYMAAVLTGPEHWRAAIVQYFEPRSVLAAGVLLVVALAPARSFHRVAAASFFAGSLVLYGLAWKLDGRLFSFRPYPTVSLCAFERSLVGALFGRVLSPPAPRAELAAIPGACPRLNIVLIVDESVAADHLSLNGYPRETTPFLAALEKRGLLVNLGAAVAGTTCSHTSGNLLLTGIRPTQLPAEALLEETPSLFQYAHAAGHRTHLLDGQMTTFWLGSHTLYRGRAEDRATVDDWRPANGFSAVTRAAVDRRLAESVREILSAANEKAFVWVWKSGAHFPYTSCYSASEAIWHPAASDGRHPVSVLNAYDNCIRAAVDGFFEQLLAPPRPWLEHTVFVYTSDHGQLLGRGGPLHTHCGLSSSEVVVPLFAIGTTGVAALRVAEWRQRAAHENVFATLLDLLEIPQASRRPYYARSLASAGVGDHQRFYFGPDLRRGSPLLFPEGLIAEGAR